MADEREILRLSNASNHNLEKCLNFAQNRRQFISPHSFAKCKNLHVVTQQRLIYYLVCCKSYICTRARANTGVTILVLLVQLPTNGIVKVLLNITMVDIDDGNFTRY